MDPEEGVFEVADDNVEGEIQEDQATDNLEEDPEALADDLTDEPEQVEGEEPDPEAEDVADAVITLPDGETLTIDEFEEIRGNSLRAADYTRKTTELAEERKSVATERETVAKRSQHLETAFQGLVQYLEGIVPPEPALDLARTNPNEYQYQKALRQQSLAEIAPLIQMKEDAQTGQAQVSTEEKARYVEKESAALVKAMPHLSDPIKRTAFDKAIKKTALEFGFSEADAQNTVDHRLLQVMHYARLGKVAETNRKNATRRVETAKPGRSKPASNVQSSESARAMKRLAKSGSIEDAMKIDFD